MAPVTTPPATQARCEGRKNSLRDADQFCRFLDLIAPTSTRKTKHNVKCPGGDTMSVWPARESVAGTCKGPGDRTYDPLTIIAKVRVCRRRERTSCGSWRSQAPSRGSRDSPHHGPDDPQRPQRPPPVPPKAEPTTLNHREVDHENDEPVGV